MAQNTGPRTTSAGRSRQRGFKGRGAHAAAVTSLGQRIVRGEFEPGEILDLQRLEVEMRFGRTALREAVKVLASKGLIDALQGTGTFVTERSHWNLLDPDLLRWHYETQPKQQFLDSLLEFRLSVEPAAAGFAALRRSPAQLADLRDALADMADNLADADAFTEADFAFHSTILEAANNEFFTQLEPIIEAALFTRIRSVRSTNRKREEALASHRLLFEAIEAGDPHKATDASRDLLAVARRQEPHPPPTRPRASGAAAATDPQDEDADLAIEAGV
ncbi:MAG TPA: FadR/GntR family transcriptional regulator [Solirubrobacteraceae bacterium]|nr:FadR/GntR family transcriptional regulator [Solirubrobacteraceae bacterium]